MRRAEQKEVWGKNEANAREKKERRTRVNMIARKRKTPRREDEGEEEEEMDDDLEKRGKVLLWDLLVNDNDDVCFKHILP